MALPILNSMTARNRAIRRVGTRTRRNFLLTQTHTRRYAMKKLLEMIAKALVDHPEELEVRSVEGQRVIRKTSAR